VRAIVAPVMRYLGARGRAAGEQGRETAHRSRHEPAYQSGVTAVGDPVIAVQDRDRHEYSQSQWKANHDPGELDEALPGLRPPRLAVNHYSLSQGGRLGTLHLTSHSVREQRPIAMRISPGVFRRRCHAGLARSLHLLG
jgi:hypothetical protein